MKSCNSTLSDRPGDHPALRKNRSTFSTAISTQSVSQITPLSWTLPLAIVTGGASGIGFGISEALIEAGYDVVLVGRSEERLAAASKSLGSSAQWRRADVGYRADIEKAFADFERISLVVNAAGFTKPVRLSTPLEEAERDWDAIINANLKGSFLTAMLAASKLRSPGGSIINLVLLVPKEAAADQVALPTFLQKRVYMD